MWTEKVPARTMISCTNMLDKLGFKTQFQAVANGLKSLTTDFTYKPQDVKIVNFYFFKESDSDDIALLYAIETANGERGTLSEAFRHDVDSEVTNFIGQVEAIEKRSD